MLTPAWKLPVTMVALAALAVVLLPGAEPGPLFGAVGAAIIVAALIWLVLRRRERRG